MHSLYEHRQKRQRLSSLRPGANSAAAAAAAAAPVQRATVHAEVAATLPSPRPYALRYFPPLPGRMSAALMTSVHHMHTHTPVCLVRYVFLIR